MNNYELSKYFGTKIIIKWEHEVGDPKRKLNERLKKYYGINQQTTGD